jgi:8-oxo-dGTP pyrophosphatase MutT (NUDIX family)
VKGGIVIKAGKQLAYLAAGGVVVNGTGTEVLLLVRPSRDEVRLPKGHVEEGESLNQAALREVREEAGLGDLVILADLGEQLVTFYYQGAMVRRTEHYYLMRPESLATTSQPTNAEDQFFPVWVELDEALSHLTFEAEREWLRRARRVLEQST